MSRFTRTIFLIWWGWCGVSLAQAHPLDLGYFHLEQERALTHTDLRASLELNPRAIELISGFASHALNAETLSANAVAMEAATLQKVNLKVSGATCTWSNLRTHWVDDAQIQIFGDAECPQAISDLNIQFEFLAKASSTFQILGKLIMVDSTEEERSFLIEKNNTSFTIQNFTQANPHFFQFVSMGMKHIGAAPSEWVNEKGLHLPDGIDHILFILALILGGGGFISLLKTATGFTIGHSVTLALASLGLVHLPSRWVESAIALSIVYVSVEALFLKDSKNRWKIAMAFGLVHGFGFASALQDLALPRNRMLEALVGFNLGVELGQACILALIVPIVLWFRNYSAQSIWMVRASAAFIGMVGSYWFVMRAFVL